MAIAGVDVGTTGCKCTIYSKNGELLKEAYAEYDMDDSHGGRELDPEMVWLRVKEVIKKAGEGMNDLKAMSVTSFGEAVVLLDEEDKPVMNTLLYTDSRGEEQCKRLTEILGSQKIAEITGLNPHNNYSISKVMWIKDNCPDAYKNVKKIFLYSDFIEYMLCKKSQIDYSLAARTMAFDLKTLSWSKEILNAAQIEIDKMPEPVPTGSKNGLITKEMAQELGIPESVMIVTGCHDQIAAAVGTGVFDEGVAVDGAGTVECITPVFLMPVQLEVMKQNQYAIVPYVFEGKYVSYAYSFTGGALLKWYRDKIAPLEAEQYKKEGLSAYDGFNRSLKAEISDLLILPHFAGAATPYMDSDSKGAMIGLTLETESSDIYQALMEAVAFEMRLNLERMKEAGIAVNSLRACGGGALSKQWLQMKADILGLPITSLGAVQAGTLGCVMLAGVACGIYSSLWEAAEVFIHIERTAYPRADMCKKYSEKYQKYKKLYEAVKFVIS